MSKILEVQCCGDCRYLRNLFDPEETNLSFNKVLVCEKSMRVIVFKGASIGSKGGSFIPDWCELEDAYDVLST